MTDLVFCFSPDDRRVAARAWSGFLDGFAGINAPAMSDTHRPQASATRFVWSRYDRRPWICAERTGHG